MLKDLIRRFFECFALLVFTTLSMVIIKGDTVDWNHILIFVCGYGICLYLRRPYDKEDNKEYNYDRDKYKGVRPLREGKTKSNVKPVSNTQRPKPPFQAQKPQDELGEENRPYVSSKFITNKNKNKEE